MEQQAIKSGRCGQGSVYLDKPVYIVSNAAIVGKKEGEGPLGPLFDMVEKDDLFGGTTWEEAESILQNRAVGLALSKGGLQPEEIDTIIGGDLLGQCMATSFGIANYQIPLLGVYGACSTCGEALALGSMIVAAGFAGRVVCVTSSHFAGAEKEFRYPLDYGNQRPLSATRTVTGSGAFVLEAVKPAIHPEENAGCITPAITGMTIGRIVDYGLKDSLNMGACMAPAAADTLKRHFIDCKSQPSEYDKIITGDLGKVGKRILEDLLLKEGYDIGGRHMDCGIEIFDGDTQDTHAGGSGCGCSAVTLSAFILRQMKLGIWKKVLFVPTGALLSKTSFNEGNSVPGIAHAVVLEAI